MLVLGLGCALIAGPQPRPGLIEYQSGLHRSVPGAIVNVAGGNLIVPEVALSIDTVFGEHVVTAHYNSAGGAWAWSFDMTYDGSIFVDATGARHVVRDVAFGAAIPGTHWVRIDAIRLKTKGGLVHTFNPGTHRLLQIAWAVGPVEPRLQFVPEAGDPQGRPGRLQQCRSGDACRDVYTIQRDARGCVSAIDDRADRHVEIESDAACRATRVRDALAVEAGWAGRRYTYAGSLLESRTNSQGERVEYAYEKGQLVAVRAIGEGDPTTRFAYGYSVAEGLYTATVVDPEGGETVYRYDGLGRLHARVDALGNTTRWTWSGRRPVSHVDVSGVETRWDYEDDDPVARYDAGGNVLHITYAKDAIDPVAPRRRPILRVEDALGVLAERTYTGGGWPVGVRNGALETTTFGFDADGLLSVATTPAGLETRLGDFGDHGHPAVVSRDSVFEHRIHDEVGNRVEGEDVSSPLGPGRPGVVRNRFDAARNLAGVALRGGTDAAPGIPETAETVIEYRDDGQVRRVLRPYGGDIERDYDAIGRVVAQRERVDGVWRATTYAWDLAGRLVAVERPNGMRREIDYDAAGKPIEIRLRRGGVVSGRLVLEYANGRLVGRTDSSRQGVERFEYDAAGRVSRVVYPDGEVRESDFDLRSREVERRYRLAAGAPPLRSLGFAYDPADRLIALYEDGVSRFERSLSAGRVDEERLGNGLVRRYTYDEDLGQLTGSVMIDAENELIEDTTLELTSCSVDEACLLARTRSIGAPSSGAGVQTDEAYVFPLPAGATVETDRPGARLTAFAETSHYDVVPNMRRDHAFDVLGNWIGRGPEGGTAPVSEFAFNVERNRLIAKTSVPTRSYVYDAAGYLVDRDGEALVWDAGGRIERIGADLEFEWDVLGRPVARRVAGVMTRTRFGGEVEADASGFPLALDLGLLRIDLASGAHRYRHRDFRGNVKLVTDDSGLAVLHYAYAPFGVRARYGVDPDTMQFAGGRALGDFVRIGARLYDPEVGRFISPDPVAHAINAYAYTLGNPALFWDPDGLNAVPTPTAGNPGTGPDWISADTAHALLLLGTGLVAASVGAGNPAVAAVGIALWTAGLAMNAFEAGEATPETAAPEAVNPQAAPPPPPASECMCGQSGSGGGGGGGDGTAESASSASTCAPSALAEAPITGRPLIVLSLLHGLLGAAWWFGARRRRPTTARRERVD